MKEEKPFDTSKKPKNPYPFLMPVAWIGSLFFCARAKGGKITYHGCENLKPPYILLSNHSSTIDFALAIKSVFPHRANWVISIEEFIGREWLLRGIGGIYKRKFTADVTVVRHILHVLKKEKRILIMYPEARFSLAGIEEKVSPAIGSLIKTAKVPVAVMIEKGNFLCEPQWNKKPCRGNRVTADVTQVITQEEAETLSAEELNEKVKNAFRYDDYRWQEENKIRIRSKKRANNLHKILYQCPVCKTEFSTNSKDTALWCDHCGAKWEMDEYGKLHCLNKDETFTHVPDWYRWERENVKAEVRSGQYRFEDTVRLERLVNCRVGFRKIGTVTLTHDGNGFTMEGTLDNGEPFRLNRPVLSMESCHIEYIFHKRGVTEAGDALELATLNDTYFAFPTNAYNPLTKLHFATEELYDLFYEQQHSDNNKIPEENS